ncbi:IS1096 element passenger TnpR family protein [Natrialbaceae archaeon AArc-T1-2]|uniref:IS1096 element passenger TnpR family protein n=1 Tax=Natrialbaceae archaeon AArc-T1-2 TaxID=3053904 RepID=UPI00255A8D1C|nr:hypothetical protein [Natrialbaceae archaeon AArc-T1-2]WIV68841.1 hypothetical protein QQ977_16195 [Natrialbaceae archaeon AArc-T1-2]
MTDGDCYLCGETYTKRGMSRHLRTCLPEGDGSGTAFHLRIAGARRSDYWLHLVVDAETTLSSLDAFLRAFWLECCGHMSAFTIENTRYEKPYDDQTPAYGIGGGRHSMDVAIESVLEATTGEEFSYEYDFGSTTALEIRVVDIGDWSIESLEKRGTDAVETGVEGVTAVTARKPTRFSAVSYPQIESVSRSMKPTENPDIYRCNTLVKRFW